MSAYTKYLRIEFIDNDISEIFLFLLRAKYLHDNKNIK